MDLNVNEWKPFLVSDLFDVYNGKGLTKEEIENNQGNLEAVQSGEQNHGSIGKIDIEYCRKMGYTLTEEPCLTVARTGSAGYVAYQPFGCVVGDSAKLLLLKKEERRSAPVYLFLRTVLLANQYKYTYGRKVTKENYLAEKIKLPAIDKNRPDWDFMEDFIHSLNCEPISTKNSRNKSMNLDTKNWKEFFLHRILNAQMGNGIDAVLTTNEAPKYNYVSRNGNDNGVIRRVDEMEDETPFLAGDMTLALGGSLGACFLQKEPFYTSQNMAVLQEKEQLSDYVKLFLATVIRNECKVKYQAFGRELNAHIKNDFTVKLPVLRDENGFVTDASCEYSNEGWIPDWDWMERYILSLPYGDRI